MSEFITQLKAATQSTHKAIESTHLSQMIMSPELDVHTYLKYLSKTKGLHESMEKTVFPKLAGLIGDIDKRRKSELLTSDLSKLNTSFDENSIEFIDLNYNDNLYFNLGMLYVSEGSTLGGQYILKHVSHTLNDTVPTRFLEGYRDKTGAMWKELIILIDKIQATATEKDRQQIISGANYAFKRVFELFNA